MWSLSPFKILVLPLTAAALLCLLLSWWAAEGFSQWSENVLQGLAATFLGLLIAIVFVERAQEVQKMREWQNVAANVNRRVRRVSIDLYNHIAEFSDLQTFDVYDEAGISIDIWYVQEFPRHETGLNATIAGVDIAGAVDISRFAEETAVIAERIELILDTYGRFLPADMFYHLTAVLDGYDYIHELRRYLYAPDTLSGEEIEQMRGAIRGMFTETKALIALLPQTAQPASR